MGRMFVQFVALCYYEYLSEQVRQLKLSLGRENGDPTHDNKDTLDRENRLKVWLKNTLIYRGGLRRRAQECYGRVFFRKTVKLIG